MRTLLMLSVLAWATLHGAEAAAPTMREKLRARILEAAPSPAPPAPVAGKKEDATPVVLMRPVIVSEARQLRALTSAIEEAEQERRAARFSPLAGGKLGTLAGMQVGSWWSPGEGWTFLRRHPPRVYRQTDVLEAKIKELQDLAKLGVSSKR